MKLLFIIAALLALMGHIPGHAAPDTPLDTELAQSRHVQNYQAVICQARADCARLLEDENGLADWAQISAAGSLKGWQQIVGPAATLQARLLADRQAFERDLVLCAKQQATIEAGPHFARNYFADAPAFTSTEIAALPHSTARAVREIGFSSRTPEQSLDLVQDRAVLESEGADYGALVQSALAERVIFLRRRALVNALRAVETHDTNTGNAPRAAAARWRANTEEAVVTAAKDGMVMAIIAARAVFRHLKQSPAFAVTFSEGAPCFASDLMISPDETNITYECRFLTMR